MRYGGSEILRYMYTPGSVPVILIPGIIMIIARSITYTSILLNQHKRVSTSSNDVAYQHNSHNMDINDKLSVNIRQYTFLPNIAHGAIYCIKYNTRYRYRVYIHVNDTP